MIPAAFVPVPEELLAEQRAFHEAMGEDLLGLPVDEHYLARARATWDADDEPPDPAARHVDADGVGLRVLDHPAPRAVVLHVHGGGWVTRRTDLADGWLGLLRDRAGVTVAAVDYRPAPERQHPGQLEEIEAALRWIATEGREVLGADRVALAGESAGAHLAAALLVRLGRTAPELRASIDAAALTYGCYDLAGVLPSQRRSTAATPILSAAQLAWHAPAYRGGADPFDPEVSPLWADLSGMPPALFSVGDADPFVDDTVLMAARWALAGNDARLDLYPGAVHAFDLFGLGIGHYARERIAAWLAATLAARAPVEALDREAA